MVASKDIIFDTRVDTNKIYVSMKTKFTIRKYPNRETLPLYLHITGGGIRKRLKLDIEVEHRFWNEKKQLLDPKLVRAKVSDQLIRNLHDVNLILANINSKVTAIKTVYRLSEKTLSAERLRYELINDLPRVNFCSFYQHALNDDKPKIDASTFRKLQAVLNKLKEFNADLIFSELDLNWFEKYRNHLAKIGNQKTTINSNIKCIKRMIRIALKSGIKIPCDVNDIVSGPVKGNRNFLTATELTKTYNYFKSEFIPEEKKLILGYFLFSCFTGLRFSDVMDIERKDLTDDYVQFITKKTKKNQLINLNESVKVVIENCPNLFKEKLTNQYINRELKVIFSSISIRKKITFHCSRHTFATSLLRAGAKVEYVQALLGHSDIKQTMIYAHIVAQDANKEIYLLDNFMKN